MSRHDRERLEGILASIAAIRIHLERGDLNDGLVHDAVRVRMIELEEEAGSLLRQVGGR